MPIAEFIGVVLVGYGIWYGYKGVVRMVGSEKDWWRPMNRRQRYPYPAAGVLLGFCFIVLGLRFALNFVWEHARTLSYVGIGLFVAVLLTGVVQPRFLHPRWYGRLYKQFGRQRVMLLQREAQSTDPADWVEIVATEASFEQWVRQVAPSSPPKRRRGYARSADREPKE